MANESIKFYKPIRRKSKNKMTTAKNCDIQDSKNTKLYQRFNDFFLLPHLAKLY